MMRSIYLKTLYDKRFFILGWTLGFITLSALMVSFYPAMSQDGSIDALVESMPEAFKGLVGNLADLNEFPTYIASQLFDIRLPIIAGVMAIILGLSLSVSEEEKGELRTIVSLPISRAKLYFEKWCAMITIMLVSIVGVVGGIYLLSPFVEGVAIPFDVTMRLAVMTWLMMIAFGTVPFSLGMATGKRVIASGVSLVVIIGGFLLSTFAEAVDWLKDYEQFSLLHFFPAVDIAKDTIHFSDVFVLVAVSSVLLFGAYVMFRRRDIA